MNSNADCPFMKGCDDMGHTPFGYKIKNGCAVIDEDAQITEKDKSRLINRASRPIIGLSDFRETIDEYLVG